MNKLIKDRRTLYFVLSIMIISVFTLSVAYAAMSAVLEIHGNSEVVASNWDIHLENAILKEGSVKSNVPEIIENNTLSFNVELNTPGDFYEFTVDVVNDGSIDAMIDDIIKAPELTNEQSKYIKYDVSYSNGDSIAIKQILEKGSSVQLKVRIEYRRDIFVSDLPINATRLDLKLILVYIQNNGIDNNTSDGNNYNNELYNLMKGNTYVYGELISYEDIKETYGEVFIESDIIEAHRRLSENDFDVYFANVMVVNDDATATGYGGYFLRDSNTLVYLDSDTALFSEVFLEEGTKTHFDDYYGYYTETISYDYDSSGDVIDFNKNIVYSDESSSSITLRLKKMGNVNCIKENGLSYKIVKAKGILPAGSMIYGINTLEDVSYNNSFFKRNSDGTISLKIISSEFSGIDLPFDTWELTNTDISELYSSNYYIDFNTVYDFNKIGSEPYLSWQEQTGIFFMPILD